MCRGPDHDDSEVESRGQAGQRSIQGADLIVGDEDG